MRRHCRNCKIKKLSKKSPCALRLLYEAWGFGVGEYTYKQSKSLQGAFKRRKMAFKPINNIMKAILKTYALDTLTDTENVEIPENYDGNPYGDTVPFSVGSNQSIEVIDA